MRHSGTATAALFATLVVPALAKAQSFTTDGSTRIIWQQVFASPLDDWVNHVVPTRDGHFVVAGFLNRADEGSDWRALLAKLAPDGRVIWQREHGAGSGVDAWWAVDEGSDGRFTAAGFTTRIGAGGIDALVGVLTSDGALVREGAFGGSGYDRATDLARADDGYLLAGFTERPAPHKRDVLLTDIRLLPSWTDRFRLIREHAFPPAAFMRVRYKRQQGWMLPALYAHRLLTGATRWIRL